MAVEPTLAREFDLTINTGTDQAPVWTVISGITGITPGQSSTKTDDTDFDTDGWEAGTVVMRGKSLSVAMNYKEDPSGGAQDPGQDALLTLGEATGPSAKGKFKYVSPGGNGHTFRGTVDVAWPGGEKAANATVTAEITLDGKPVPVTP